MDKKDYSKIQEIWNQGNALVKNYTSVLNSYQQREISLSKIRNKISTDSSLNWDKIDYIISVLIRLDYKEYYLEDSVDRTRIRQTTEYNLVREVNQGNIQSDTIIDWSNFDVLFTKVLKVKYNIYMNDYAVIYRKLDDIRFLINKNIQEAISILNLDINKEIDWNLFQEYYEDFGLCCKNAFFAVKDYNEIVCSLVGNIDTPAYNYLLSRKDEAEQIVESCKDEYISIIGLIFDVETI